MRATRASGGAEHIYLYCYRSMPSLALAAHTADAYRRAKGGLAQEKSMKMAGYDGFRWNLRGIAGI